MTTDIDGLWSVEFATSEGRSGAGVLVFADGRVLGGDQRYYLVGDYRVEAGELHGRLVATHYAGDSHPALGAGAAAELELAGRLLRADEMTLRAAPVAGVGPQFFIRLTRRAPLR